MSNMSYCRFRNTLNDFADCRNAIEEMIDTPEECGALSWDELQAAKALAQEAIDFLVLLSDYSGLSFEDLVDCEDKASDAIDLINEEVKTAEAIGEE